MIYGSIELTARSAFPPTRSDHAKRIVDISLGVFGLIGLAPVFLTIAGLVYLTTGRPVLFRQRRVGWRGSEFILYKFRTMAGRTGSEHGSFEPGSMSRITPIGKFLRKAKLDELPQLWNVLKGDMSLVGPRPEVREWVDAFPERWQLVHTVRPGITDPASIQFRSEEQILASSADPVKTYRDQILPAKLALYEKYVENHSVWGDIKILIQTIRILPCQKPPAEPEA